MSRHLKFIALLLASTSAVPSFAQQQPPTDDPAATAPPTEDAAVTQPSADGLDDMMDDGEAEEIVVVGQKPRGSVAGDIPPENT